jgi:NADH:ubiquinone oxidoreductase subunit 3 (subunit A)
MESILLSPPVAFTVLFAVIALIIYLSKFIAAKGILSAGKEEAYASGEDYKVHHVEPDYSQFFPFAFFFTIMHVVVLIVATVPKEISLMAFIYVFIALLVLFILLRK